MRCHRCQGFMDPVDLLDWASGSGQDRSRAWRCVACGEIIDEAILSNRETLRQTHHTSSQLGARRGRRYARVYPAAPTIRRDAAVHPLITIR